MTPRIINPSSGQDLGAVFSESLIREMKGINKEHNLKVQAPLFDLLHPKLIEARLKYLHNPEQEAASISIPGWYIYPLANTAQAPKDYDQVYGQPYEIGKILKNDLKQVVIDFNPLGAVIISRAPLDVVSTPGLHQHLIPVWMSYVLSPELWGTQGKWTRFHERLHLLFERYSLLKGQDYPGFYPLDIKAQRLEEFGFHGSVVQDNYTLVLPWTFPLTALQQLEKVIVQEF